MSEPTFTPLALAISFAGGPAALARFITEHQGKISAQAICDWKRCPADRAVVVEKATVDPESGKPRVSRHELRPDVFPADEREAA